MTNDLIWPFDYYLCALWQQIVINSRQLSPIAKNMALFFPAVKFMMA